MLFALKDSTDTEGQGALRRSCFEVLKRIEVLRGDFFAAPADPFAAHDPVDRATRFGSLIFAAQAMARAGCIPGPDPARFLDSLAHPGKNCSIVAFFARGLDERSRETRLREVSQVVFPVLSSLPGVTQEALKGRELLDEAGSASVRNTFALLRGIAFEMRKPTSILEAIGSEDEAAQKIYARFQASCLAGVNMEALELLLAPRVVEPAIEAVPDLDL